tara:strand:- start:407 stop:538 length:132 start_codon:yes stop_codon:yes gene_type:complete
MKVVAVAVQCVIKHLGNPHEQVCVIVGIAKLELGLLSAYQCIF